MTVFATIPASDGRPALEALWVGTGERACVIAPPHPLMGGHLSNPVVGALAEGFQQAGLRCLLFNFRGVGDSEGEPSGDPDDADRDYSAALAFAGETASVVVASGYSFGAAAAVRAAVPRTELHAVAVAPPPVLFPPGALAALGGRLTIIAGGRDAIARASELERLVAGSPGVGLETIADADHFFTRGLDSVRDAARRAVPRRPEVR